MSVIFILYPPFSAESVKTGDFADARLLRFDTRSWKNAGTGCISEGCVSKGQCNWSWGGNWLNWRFYGLAQKLMVGEIEGGLPVCGGKLMGAGAEIDAQAV